MKRMLVDLSKKVSIYGLGTAFNSAASLLLVPFFVHSLQPAEYGRYALAEMVVGLFLVAIGLGTNVAIVSQVPRMEEEEQRRYIGTAITFSICSAATAMVLMLAIIAGFSQALEHFLPISLVTLIPIAIALEYVLLQLQSIYRALGGAWSFVLMTIAQASCSLVSTVVLIYSFGFREEGILLGRVIGVFMALGPGLILVLRYRPQFDATQVRAMLGVGVPLVPATICSLLVSMSPRYFLELFSTTEQVGVFAIASKVAGIIAILFVQPFSLAWMAVVSKISASGNAPAIYARVLTYFSLAGFSFATIVGLLSPVVLYYFGQARYAISQELILILCYANVAAGLMYTVNLAPYITGRTIQQLPVFLMSGFVALVLGTMFTLHWGLYGAASALLCSLLFQSILLGVLSHREMPVSIEWARLVKCFMAIAVSLLVASMFGTPVHRVAVFLTGLGFLLVVTRFFDSSEYRAVRRLLTPSVQ